jgi:hypothetical protein
VTFNTADFPPEACQVYGVEAQHPDGFLISLWSLDQPIMIRILHEQAQAIGRSVEQLVKRLGCDAPEFGQLAFASLALNGI